MENNEEIQVAFTIWELTSQLETLLWERYFDEFNDILSRMEEDRWIELNKHFPFKK